MARPPVISSMILGTESDPAVEYYSHVFADVRLGQACQLQGAVFGEHRFPRTAYPQLIGSGLGAGYVAVAQSNFGRDP